MLLLPRLRVLVNQQRVAPCLMKRSSELFFIYGIGGCAEYATRMLGAPLLAVGNIVAPALAIPAFCR